jgi:putative DNA primase/helicase
LPERLQQAAEEIVAWAIAGWIEYRRIGLSEPDAVLTATDQYKADSDAVGRFITDECVTTSAVMKATTAQLFEAWQRWRAQEGAPEVSQKAFGQALDRHGYPAADAVNGKRWRHGIAVKAPDADD